MNTAGYDSKFATLYYPWIEVMDPLTNQPIWCRRRATSPASGAAPTRTRGVHKAPANEVVLGANGLGFQVTQAEQGGLNPIGHQLHPRVPGPRHPHLGRAHAVERPRVALHQRPAALQLRRRVDHRGHAVGRVRAQRRAAVDRSLRIAASNFLTRIVARRARCSARRRSRRSTSSATRRPTRPRSIEAGQVVVEIGIAPVKPAEFVIFRHQPVHRGGAGRGLPRRPPRR